LTALLHGKRLVITGALTKDSIAWAVASEAQQAGAEVVLTSFGRARRLTERAAKQLPEPCDVLELDVNKPEDFSAVRKDLATRWQGVDGLLHAIAYAPEDAIGGRFMDTPASSAITAFETSAFSLKAMAREFLPLLKTPSSIVGLDFDASVAWPSYDWMGVSKAALESVSRYVARDLGQHGIRCNLVAAGPLRTAAASGIAGFAKLAAAWSSGAPLGWDPDDATPVAQAVCFLMSDWSRAISGEILHVDGGFHAMAAGVTTAGGR
jgi:enoyl-[acyl-carrier protein] reductase I